MNTDAEYVVIDRKVLTSLFAEMGSWNDEECNGWLTENELPLMTIPEFQKDMVRNTHRWFPEMVKNGTLDLNMLMYGLLGEAGECAEVMKKFIRGSLTPEQFGLRLAEESVDLFHYLALLWVVTGTDPGIVYHQKTLINEERFGPKDDD